MPTQGWISHFGLPGWPSGKESTCQWRRHGFNPWVRKIPCRRKRRTLVCLPGKSHEQRSLVGYSPWALNRAGRHWAHRQLAAPGERTRGWGPVRDREKAQVKFLRRPSSFINSVSYCVVKIYSQGKMFHWKFSLLIKVGKKNSPIRYLEALKLI